jgi:4-hydroxy-tetrahydrodipicolinate reductase
VTLRVAVLGAAGRMGSTVCAAVAATDDLELVAAVDPGHPGGSVAGGLVVGATADAALEAGATAVVDFTVPSAAMGNLRWASAHGLHAVVGTTGLGPADFDELGGLYPSAGPAGCIVAANFALGAVLMMRFAELAAPWFATAEIIELHHDAKVDAPSGTALTTASRMAEASATWAPDPTTTEGPPGARGAQGPGGIHIHSVRLRGLVAHQEVLLGDDGQTLTIRHDSTDRASFMPGVLAALRAVASRPGLTVGLDQVLGL